MKNRYTFYTHTCGFIFAFIAINLFTDQWKSIFILLENFLLVWIHRKNNKMLVISAFILWSNYSIVMANVLSPTQDEFISKLIGTTGMKKALDVLLFFNTFIFIMLKEIKEVRVTLNECFNKKKNNLISWGLIFLLIIVYFLGFEKGEIGERSDPSPLYEYSYIFFVLAFAFSNKKIIRIILSIELIIFALSNLIYGGRITAVQLFICWLFCIIPANTNVFKYSPYAFVGIIILSAVGGLRGAAVESFDVFELAFKSLMNGKMQLDTAYYAFYTSITFVLVNAHIAFDTQIYLLWQFILSIFLGSSVPDSILPEYTLKYYFHQNGGVLPLYAYFYLGYFGVYLLTIYIRWILKKVLASNNNTYLITMGIVICVSVPRWYLYSPLPLCRGLILYSICFFICYIFNKKICRNKKCIGLYKR